VGLDLPASADALLVPASALVFDRSGLHVATVGEGNAVTLKTVTVLRDLGRSVLIGSGLALDDRVIENPPDGIADGAVVAPAAP
jgi:multidrug efflux pump subunit AcrA (membrane-fusion protein)